MKTTYTYDPFGKVTVTGEASDNPFQYTGRENDGTGLYYYRARYYGPELQRFISEDPIGFKGGINFYVYVGNNPVNLTDPEGLKVYRCCRGVQVNPVLDKVASTCGSQHCFIKTDAMEAGMGPANGGPLPSSPIGTDTDITDHSGQCKQSTCTEIPDVNEACVNRELLTKRPGRWWPWNNCNTVVNEILKKCKRHGASGSW